MTRLIDADALNEKLCETTIFIKDSEVFQRMINDAPTIELDGDTISIQTEETSTNTSTDLISRQDAIEAVENNSYGMGSRASVKAIKALPSAELPKGDLISRADAVEMAVDVEAPQGTYERAIYVDDLMALPSAEAEQVTGKLNNPCDSLLTDDSEECKEQKSKLDLISRQDAIRKCCGEKCGCEREDCGYTECCSEVSRLERLPSAPDSRQRETNKEIAERIIDNTCKNRVFCELYPDACRKEDCDIYLVINTFLNTPDIDTQIRQRGEWVRKYDGHINCYWYECDQCGEYRPRNQFGHEYNANFCPNCGADMKGQNDGQKR